MVHGDLQKYYPTSATSRRRIEMLIAYQQLLRDGADSGPPDRLCTSLESTFVPANLTIDRLGVREVLDDLVSANPAGKRVHVMTRELRHWVGWRMPGRPPKSDASAAAEQSKTSLTVRLLAPNSAKSQPAPGVKNALRCGHRSARSIGYPRVDLDRTADSSSGSANIT